MIARSFTGGQHFELFAVQVADHSESKLSDQSRQSIDRMAWLANGRELIMIAQDANSALPQVWHISYLGGAARRVTNDLHRYRDFSLTAASRVLVTVHSERYANLWSARVDDETPGSVQARRHDLYGKWPYPPRGTDAGM